LVAGPADATILGPQNHYSYSAFMAWEWYSATLGWFHNRYPNLKTIFTWSTDDLQGHQNIVNEKKGFAAFGLQLVDAMYAPATATDMSSIALKAVNDNPDILQVAGGGPALDALLIKQAYQAGYKGQMLACSSTPIGTLGAIAPPAALEGLVCSGWPVEFDPASTAMGQTFRSAWIAKYGSWTSPTISGLSCYTIVTSAIQQAGTLDTDKVTNVIGSGMKWEGPNGPGQMAPRPDVGNTRTVDAVVGYPMKTIKSMVPTLLDTLTVDEAMSYYTAVWK
jgi:ABC-type branched-subunit amino acid transport system substrate-binding protein